jgi:cell division protein FtsB
MELAHPLARIRWDRVGRWALLGVVAVILYLYIGPTVSLVQTLGEAKRQRAAVAELKARHAELRRRRAELLDSVALEHEARRLGMVKAGERAYVVRGLPDG